MDKTDFIKKVYELAGLKRKNRLFPRKTLAPGEESDLMRHSVVEYKDDGRKICYTRGSIEEFVEAGEFKKELEEAIRAIKKQGYAIGLEEGRKRGIKEGYEAGEKSVYASDNYLQLRDEHEGLIRKITKYEVDHGTDW